MFSDDDSTDRKALGDGKELHGCSLEEKQRIPALPSPDDLPIAIRKSRRTLPKACAGIGVEKK